MKGDHPAIARIRESLRQAKHRKPRPDRVELDLHDVMFLLEGFDDAFEAVEGTHEFATRMVAAINEMRKAVR